MKRVEEYNRHLVRATTLIQDELITLLGVTEEKPEGITRKTLQNKIKSGEPYRELEELIADAMDDASKLSLDILDIPVGAYETIVYRFALALQMERKKLQKKNQARFAKGSS